MSCGPRPPTRALTVKDGGLGRRPQLLQAPSPYGGGVRLKVVLAIGIVPRMTAQADTEETEALAQIARTTFSDIDHLLFCLHGVHMPRMLRMILRAPWPFRAWTLSLYGCPKCDLLCAIALHHGARQLVMMQLRRRYRMYGPRVLFGDRYGCRPTGGPQSKIARGQSWRKTS